MSRGAFWDLVDKTGDCWLWRGRLSPAGYGRTGIRQQRLAHRHAYVMSKGDIPDGLELDHLCRVRNCVNPDHLEPVTHAENHRRRAAVQTHCKRGHEFTTENTGTYAGSTKRRCRRCDVIRTRAYKQSRKAPTV